MDGEKDWRPLLWTIVLSQGYVGLEQNINYLLKGYNSAAEAWRDGQQLLCGEPGHVLGPAIA